MAKPLARRSKPSSDPQAAAVERANLWTAEQAARLDTSPAAILEAVARGWTPEAIERVESKYALEGQPSAGVCFKVIGKSPLLPDTRRDAKGSKPWTDKSLGGENMMQIAFMQAQSRSA